MSMPKARVWTHAPFQPEVLAVLDPLATVVATPPAGHETGSCAATALARTW